MEDHHIDLDEAALAHFRALPEERPVEMLNLVRFRAAAAYPAGHAAAAERLSGAAAYRRYQKESAPVFLGLGARMIWTGRPEAVLIGPGSERWDMAFVARYPSASAFLAMIADPAYRAALVHRQAAVETSRLIPAAAQE